jgi:hypothetical protein
MSRKAIRGAVVAGVIALAAFGLATPAQAISAIVYTTQGHGLMKYIDGTTGDKFEVHDLSADGYGIRGEVRSGGGTLLSWLYVNGDDVSDSWSYDLAKGKSYVIRVCRVSSALDGTPINCASEVVEDY